MKLNDLIEQVSKKDPELIKIKMWFENHCRTGSTTIDDFRDGKIYLKDREIYFLRFDDNRDESKNGKMMVEIPWPIVGTVRNLSFDGDFLNTLKNFPTVIEDISCGGNDIEKIDHPIACGGRLNLAKNKIKSVKGIHNLVKCNEICIWNNPLEEGLIDLLKIPNIAIIDSGDQAPLNNEFRHAHAALKIIARHVGEGKAGIIAAQEELFEVDLDDFV